LPSRAAARRRRAVRSGAIGPRILGNVVAIVSASGCPWASKPPGTKSCPFPAPRQRRSAAGEAGTGRGFSPFGGPRGFRAFRNSFPVNTLLKGGCGVRGPIFRPVKAPGRNGVKKAGPLSPKGGPGPKGSPQGPGGAPCPARGGFRGGKVSPTPNFPGASGTVFGLPPQRGVWDPGGPFGFPTQGTPGCVPPRGARGGPPLWEGSWGPGRGKKGGRNRAAIQGKGPGGTRAWEPILGGEGAPKGGEKGAGLGGPPRAGGARPRVSWGETRRGRESPPETGWGPFGGGVALGPSGGLPFYIPPPKVWAPKAFLLTRAGVGKTPGGEKRTPRAWGRDKFFRRELCRPYTQGGSGARVKKGRLRNLRRGWG